VFDGVTGPQAITERATEVRPREAGVRRLNQWSPDPAVCQTDRSPTAVVSARAEFRNVTTVRRGSPDPAVCQTDRSPTAVVSARAEFRKVIHDPFPTNCETCRSQPAIVFQFNERDEGRPDA
jgi:hypothetical protein